MGPLKPLSIPITTWRSSIYQALTSMPRHPRLGTPACSGERTTAGTAGETPEGQQEARRLANGGRLVARPTPPSSHTRAPTGLRPLGLSSGRDGLTYVPTGYRPTKEAPLALILHGAGGDVRSISPFLDLAGEAGLVLPTPAGKISNRRLYA